MNDCTLNNHRYVANIMFAMLGVCCFVWVILGLPGTPYPNTGDAIRQVAFGSGVFFTNGLFEWRRRRKALRGERNPFLSGTGIVAMIISLMIIAMGVITANTPPMPL